MHLITPLLIDLGIVALAMAGVLMLAWKLLQQLWGTGTSSAYQPAALLFSAGIATAVRNRFPWMRAAYRQRPDRKLMLTAAVIQ